MLAARPASTTTPRTPPRRAPSRRRPTTRATLFTTTGQRLATGVAELRRAESGWRAKMSSLDRPGAIARAYFTSGLRDVVLQLPDGRRAPARIDSTNFTAATERICELSGVDSFV